MGILRNICYTSFRFYCKKIGECDRCITDMIKEKEDEKRSCCQNEEDEEKPEYVPPVYNLKDIFQEVNALNKENESEITSHYGDSNSAYFMYTKYAYNDIMVYLSKDRLQQPDNRIPLLKKKQKKDKKKKKCT